MNIVVTPKFDIEVRRAIPGIDRHLEASKDIFTKYPGKTPKVVVDVGAHVGTFGLLAACNGSQFVYCIEAHTGNYNNLRRNIKTNKVEHKVFPVNFAVDSESFTTRKLFVGLTNTGQRSTRYSYGEDAPYERVWTLSLEDLLSPVVDRFEVIDFLKVDVEGGEFEIFAARPELTEILQHVNYIDLECHSKVDEEYIAVRDAVPDNVDTIIDYLKSLRFTVDNYGQHYHLVARRE